MAVTITAQGLEVDAEGLAAAFGLDHFAGKDARGAGSRLLAKPAEIGRQHLR